MLKSLPLVPAKERHVIKKDLRLLGKEIRQKRIEAGFTQESLAEKLDVSANMIAKIETSLRIPSLPMLLRIARALNLKLRLL